MKIKELYIRRFGKLRDYKLTFSDGMNVLFGSNEAGKTTIFNFILAMLYGFSNTRGKGISDSARKKYMTWGENKIGGTMTVENNGTTYVIDRSFGKTRAGDSLEFKNITIGEAVNLPNGREVGEYLFDLDEKSFKGTCFIGQLSKDDVCDNDSVRTKLSNLSSVGDSEYSFAEVFGRLKDSSLEITRKTSTGKIHPLELRKNELESRNRAIDNEISQLASIDAENKALESRATALSTEISQLENAINKARKYKKTLEYKKALEANSKIEALRAEYQQSADKITRNEFTADRGYIDSLNSLMKKRDDAKLKYEYEEKTFENEKKTLEILSSSKSENKTKTSALPFVLGIVASILVSALLFVLLESIIVPAVVLAVAVVAIVCAYFAINAKSKSKVNDSNEISFQKAKLNDSAGKLKSLKEAYEACNNAFAEEYLLFFEQDEISRAEENVKSLSAMIDRYVEAKSKYDVAKFSAISQETLEQMRSGIDVDDLNDNVESVDLFEFELRKNRSEDELLNIEKTLLVNKERAKGKSKSEAELENNLSTIAEINEKIKAYQYAGECLELAKQGLENAQKEMQKQFAPDVSRLVSEILSEITCGKYEQMTLSSNLQTMVIDNESGAAMEDGYMSSGTLDQIYLALRFAMIKLIFDNKEYPIVCMDDALLNFDFNRMKKATEYISAVLSKEAQVLFFTCRDTEKECFADADLINV